MLRVHNKYIWQLIRLFSLLAIVSGFILLGKGVSSALSVSGGTLSGSAYLSNDRSADSNTKVTYGNQNSVSFDNSSSNSSNIKITSGELSKSSKISGLDFGANEIWYDGGYGTQNITTGQLYPNVIKQTKDIGISILRYPGGIPSDTYHWQNAIGKQNSRTDNVVYQGQNVFLPSNFGPDEFGNLLRSTNSVGDITVNFGTGTAQEAANWVQYMTAPISNSWGQLRTKNGHPEPYNIPVWEIGNETQSLSGENYWRSGAVVSIGSNNYQCNSTDIHLCEYVYGGVTSFSNQKTLATNNSTAGNRSPNQVFYAEYPPIVSGSQVVFVNGIAWVKVNSLAGVSGNSHDYLLDNITGKITFGDGVNGAIVPNNATVSINYRSGPHDGFIQYYNLMKAADPKAKICSAYEAIDFIQLMGSTTPYDCLASHLYAGQIISTNSSASLFHNSLIQQSNNFGTVLKSEQSAINQYAGKRAKDINLAVTEYGVNALTYPYGQPNYHRSQDMALFVANSLRVMINAHIPIAEKHYLISYQNSAAPGYKTYVNSSTFSNNALIGGPGPNSILQPSAYVMQAYSKLLYSNLVNSNITNNPNTVFNGGSYPTLSSLATTDNQGNESMMIINFSEQKSVKTQVQPSINSYKTVKSWTLGSNNFLAYNTPIDPGVVGFVQKNSNLVNGKLVATFPPSSITVLQLSK